MMSKKVAVLITDEFEDAEFTSPAQTYQQAGHQVITIEKTAGKTNRFDNLRCRLPGGSHLRVWPADCVAN